MSPNPNGTERFPVGRLLDEIEKTFGSYYAFKVQFSTAAVDVFGSGTQFIFSTVITLIGVNFLQIVGGSCPFPSPPSPLLPFPPLPSLPLSLEVGPPKSS